MQEEEELAMGALRAVLGGVGRKSLRKKKVTKYRGDLPLGSITKLPLVTCDFVLT